MRIGLLPAIHSIHVGRELGSGSIHIVDGDIFVCLTGYTCAVCVEDLLEPVGIDSADIVSGVAHALVVVDGFRVRLDLMFTCFDSPDNLVVVEDCGGDVHGAHLLIYGISILLIFILVVKLGIDGTIPPRFRLLILLS